MSERVLREIPLVVALLAALCLPVMMLRMEGEQIVALIGGVVFLVLCLSLPRRWLPSFALVMLTLVPITYLPIPTVFTYLTPPLVVLLVWQFRGRLTHWAPPIPFEHRLFQTLGLALVVAMIGSRLTVHSLPGAGGHEFVISLAFAVTLAGASYGYSEGVPEVATTWAVLGGGLGVYALAEKFVLHGNPLFQRFYSLGPDPIIQNWSTYRATTSLGHPLLNATFFSIAALLGVGLYMQGHRLLLYPALLSVAGLVATVSRSGAVALGVGFLVCLTTGTFRGAVVRLRTTVTVLVLLVLAALIAQPLFSARDDSSEALVSSQYRDMLREAALQAFHVHPWLGFGPGGLPNAAAAGGLQTGGNFENSWLEFVLSDGLIGAVLLLLLIGFSVVRAYRAGNLAVAGALASYTVSMSGFNLLAAYLPAHLMLGLLLAMANSPDGDDPVEPSAAAEPRPELQPAS